MLGAVAYDPKVVAIWDGFRAWLEPRGCLIEPVLFHNYERQVEALVRGVIDVAWHSPLAWVQTRRICAAKGRKPLGFCMRDTDQDLTSVLMVRSAGEVRTLVDLRGKRVAVGAIDSPQATLIPLGQLAEHGLVAGVDFEVVPFDVLPGKHGDHIGGERDAARALVRGEVDAAAILDTNRIGFARDGTLPSEDARLLLRTEPFDHCVFAAIEGVKSQEVARFSALLLGMSWENPDVRPLLEMEGLRAWRPGRVDRFTQLEAAVDVLAFVGAARVRDFVDQQIA